MPVSKSPNKLSRLTPKLAEKILAQINQLPEVPYDLSLKKANKIDKDIYSL